MTEWEKEREKTEFEQAARLYQPLSDDLACRFTSGSQLEDVHDLLTPVEKVIDPEVETMKNAVANKMFGAFTRKKYEWIPDKVLCKRFNVPEPFKYKIIILKLIFIRIELLTNLSLFLGIRYKTLPRGQLKKFVKRLFLNF